MITKEKIRHWSNQHMWKCRQPSQIKPFTTTLFLWSFYLDVCSTKFPKCPVSNSVKRVTIKSKPTSWVKKLTRFLGLQLGAMLLRRRNFQLFRAGPKPETATFRFGLGEREGEKFRVWWRREDFRNWIERLMEKSSRPHRQRRRLAPVTDYEKIGELFFIVCFWKLTSVEGIPITELSSFWTVQFIYPFGLLKFHHFLKFFFNNLQMLVFEIPKKKTAAVVEKRWT